MKTRYVVGAAVVFAAVVGFGFGLVAAQSGVPAQAGRGAAPPPTPPCGPNLSPDIKNVAKDSRCFELRTYTVREGSSIDLLHTRFRERTTALFKKHGMTIIGYWQSLAKKDQLIYILAYKDAATRDAAWAAFGADPDWVKTRTEMQVSVQVDNVFMSATDYSPMK
jgi:NIPSNAP